MFPLTIVGSSISNLLNLFDGYGNSIEDYPFYKYKSKKSCKSLPFLSLFDLFIGILILLPKLIVNTQLIKANLKDQSMFHSNLGKRFPSLNRTQKKIVQGEEKI